MWPKGIKIPIVPNSVWTPMNAERSLIDELEVAMRGGSNERRAQTIRHITDLFLAHADRLSAEQVSLFDDVLQYLVKRIEAKARAELSGRLAPIENAPTQLILHLAQDDEIAVAEPVLTQSPVLTSQNLIEIAESKGQAHLLAISGRARIEEHVTDVLLTRGDDMVFHKLAGNSGALFSDAGYTTLVKHAEMDSELAEKIGSRVDIPLRAFRDLMSKANETVLSRLLVSADAEKQQEIRRALAHASDDVGREVVAPRDPLGAQRLVSMMAKKRQIDELALAEFARTDRFDEMVAALALMSASPFELIDRLVHSRQNDALLVPCKAADLQWPTVVELLKHRPVGQGISELDLNKIKVEYWRLSKSTSQRLLRFWQVKRTVAGETSVPTP